VTVEATVEADHLQEIKSLKRRKAATIKVTVRVEAEAEVNHLHGMKS
jgi:hypothetical protein